MPNKYLAEQWKPIKGYEGRYEVSSNGRIRSLVRATPIMMKFGYYGRQKEYRFITLTKNGQQENYLLHRIVASAFVNKIKGKNHVHHKNNIPSDNRAANLQWCTPKENSWLRFPISGEHKKYNNTELPKCYGFNNGNYKAVQQLHPKTKVVVNTYPTIAEAARFTKGRTSGISEASKHFPNKISGGYLWNYK